jgi:hypothetical protein
MNIFIPFGLMAALSGFGETIHRLAFQNPKLRSIAVSRSPELS